MSDDEDPGRQPGELTNPTIWKRWTDRQDNLHLHNVCDLVPSLEWTSDAPFVRFRPEGGDPPTFVDPDTGETRRFVFVGGLPRQILRHTPLVILLAAIVLFGGAELVDTVNGISALVPQFDGGSWLLGVWAAPLPFLVYLLYAAGVLGGPNRSASELIAVYALPLVLIAGIIASLGLVFTAESPAELPSNIVYVSGYLLTLLVGGQLFYETVLRTEHLFVNLPDTDIVRHEDDYYRLLSEMHESLSTRVLGIPAAHAFGLLFAVQFGVLWTIASGPQELGFLPNVAINTALDTVLVIATFQFVIIIRYANELLSDNGAYDHVLGYEPFHVDARGGYKDLGRFAIRFNLLIGMGALYLVYRLYASGSRGVPPEGLVGFVDQFDMLIWLINYAGPVLVFAIVLIAWVYLAFWGMHMKMLREKDRATAAYQGNPQSDGKAGAGVPNEELADGPAWEDIRDAPEWPVNPNRLRGIVTSTFLPLLFPLPGLLF